MVLDKGPFKGPAKCILYAGLCFKNEHLAYFRLLFIHFKVC